MIEEQNLNRVERRQANTKERIIEVALEAFSEYGYSKTTVNEITSRADVAHGTFYNFFKNKQDLLAVLADEIILTVDDYFTPKNKKLSVLERLFFEAKGILEFYDNHRNVLLALKEAVMIDKQFDKQLLEIHERLFERIQNDIKKSMKKGYCRNSDTDVIIIALSCMMEGYANHVTLQPPGSIDIDTTAASLADIAYHGVFITE
jgi:AcrR family transcriptional regulator